MNFDTFEKNQYFMHHRKKTRTQNEYDEIRYEKANTKKKFPRKMVNETIQGADGGGGGGDDDGNGGG